MRRFEKERLQRRSSLREHLPRPNATSDALVKLIFIALSILGAILVWSKQDEIALTAETTALLSPIASSVMQHIFAVYMLVGGAFLTILILFPLGKKAAQDQLRSIGLVNHTDMVPALKRKYKDKQNPRISVWEFSSQGIPLKTWEDKQAAIETILDITIVKMKYGSGKSRVLLYTVPARTYLPEVIDWSDKYLSPKPFILALGESFTGPVTVDLVKVPHILLGGSTGSGKSVLLKLLLMQALEKGAVVSIADFKGGVDFPPIWHKQCKMCIEEESTLTLLTELVDELQRRKALLAASGQPNIDRYNEATGEDLPRYIFACDEIAEVLDKTGLTKEQKEFVGKIETSFLMVNTGLLPPKTVNTGPFP